MQESLNRHVKGLAHLPVQDSRISIQNPVAHLQVLQPRDAPSSIGKHITQSTAVPMDEAIKNMQMHWTFSQACEELIARPANAFASMPHSFG